MGVLHSGISGNREFPATTPSVILHAGNPESPDHARHLARLVELYWRPVYCVVRHAWGKSHDDAKDLTQEFFATVVLDRSLAGNYAGGGFRVLLRTALSRFLTDVARTAGRQKRAGETAAASLEQIGAVAVEAIPGAQSMAPDELFDAAWNETLMMRALELLEQKLRSEGKAVAFQLFR